MDILNTQIAIILSIALELCLILFLKRQSYYVKLLALASVTITSFTTTLFIFESPNLYTLAYSIVAVFRIINISRIAIGRMNINELKQKYFSSAIWLISMSLIILLFGNLELNIINLQSILYFSLTSSIIILISTVYSSFKWRNKISDKISEAKLPTVSICIPARNETQDLPECIESMIDSNYSKLEILVLDDCSHDKTPAVIKEYAHRGVRFISGTEPDDDWLPKNQAMNKLFDEAKGDIVIFAGVDVRFSKKTVAQIVNKMQSGNEMLSVLPRRSFSSELSVFIQPLRYWWELCVPRIVGGRPPILSTCWAIKADSLERLGEFDSFRKSVQPEAHFAKRLKNNYSFTISGTRMGVTSIKRARDQYDTAIRTRYPQVKRRLELVPILLLIEVLIFFMPLIGLINGYLEKNNHIILISLASVGTLVLINTYISFITVYRTWIFGLITLPFLLFEEWFILIRSMLAYEFGVVIWKDRNICLPMYKVEKSLPKIDIS